MEGKFVYLLSEIVVLLFYFCKIYLWIESLSLEFFPGKMCSANDSPSFSPLDKKQPNGWPLEYLDIIYSKQMPQKTNNDPDFCCCCLSRPESEDLPIENFLTGYPVEDGWKATFWMIGNGENHIVLFGGEN